jgi:hypothetical protein
VASAAAVVAGGGVDVGGIGGIGRVGGIGWVGRQDQELAEVVRLRSA